MMCGATWTTLAAYKRSGRGPSSGLRDCRKLILGSLAMQDRRTRDLIWPIWGNSAARFPRTSRGRPGNTLRSRRAPWVLLILRILSNRGPIVELSWRGSSRSCVLSEGLCGNQPVCRVLWRGGRRDDSARTRRIILISTQRGGSQEEEGGAREGLGERAGAGDPRGAAL